MSSALLRGLCCPRPVRAAAGCRPSWPGAVLCCAACALLALGAACRGRAAARPAPSPRCGWASPLVVQLGCPACALLALSPAVERGAARPALPAPCPRCCGALPLSCGLLALGAACRAAALPALCPRCCGASPLGGRARCCAAWPATCSRRTPPTASVVRRGLRCPRPARAAAGRRPSWPARPALPAPWRARCCAAGPCY